MKESVQPQTQHAKYQVNNIMIKKQEKKLIILNSLLGIFHQRLSVVGKVVQSSRLLFVSHLIFCNCTERGKKKDFRNNKVIRRINENVFQSSSLYLYSEDILDDISDVYSLGSSQLRKVSDSITNSRPSLRLLETLSRL